MKSVQRPYRLLPLFITLLALTLVNYTHTSNKLPSVAQQPQQAFNQEESWEDSIYDYINEDDIKQARQQVQQTPCTADTVVDTLVGAGIINLLKVPIYKHTNSILNRSIHDLPTFNWVTIYRDCFDISVFPFYNQTSKLFFIRSNPFINSYLNLTGNDFIDALDQVVEDLEVQVAPSEILPLFRTIKLQERRTGLYFRFGAHNNDWDIKFSIPLYYIERNFFLTEKEIEAISFNPAIRKLSEGSSRDETEELLTEHLVSDRLGLGDLRIHALYAPWQNEPTRWSLGGFITLPTAFAFKQGIIGGSFCKVRSIPPFNLQQLVCDFLSGSVAQEIRSTEQLTDLAFAVLDNLTANVADISLGNRHVTIAPLVQYEHFFNSCWGIRSQGSIQYVVPGKERRYFIKRVNPEQFNRDFTDPNQAEANLAFIQQQALNTLFPSVLNVTVHPGPIVNFNGALLWNYSCFNAAFGYDFWWQGQEKLEVTQQQAKTFLINKAINSPGLQQKIFGNIELSIPYSCGTLQAGLRGDLTFSSQGIGKDFTLAFSLAFYY